MPDSTCACALDALEQALYDRQVKREAGLIHHSDRGVQYLSIRYTERLAEAGIEPLVGSVGDSYEREACPRGVMPCRSRSSVYTRTKSSVATDPGARWKLSSSRLWTGFDWFNHRRLLEPIGDVPPVEKENAYYQETESALAA